MLRRRKDLEEVINQGDTVLFRVFVDTNAPQYLTASVNGLDFTAPTLEKDGAHGWEFVLAKEGKERQEFHVKSYGFLVVPDPEEDTSPDPPNLDLDPEPNPDPEPDPEVDPSTVSCELTPGNPHDASTNETVGGQTVARGTYHGFYAQDALTGQEFLMGEFESAYGEIQTYGDWKKATFLGREASTNKRLVGHKESYAGAVTVKMRTRSGCNPFTEIRSTEVNGPITYNPKPLSESGHDAFDLSPSPIGIGTFRCAGFSQGTGGSSFIYEFLIAGASGASNLTWRMKGGSWKTTTARLDGVRSLDDIGSVNHWGNPTFFFDLSNDGGQSYERFMMNITSLRGHFATAFKMVRCRDGETWVSNYVSGTRTPTKLRIDSVEYSSGYFGCSHNVGQIGEARKTGLIIFTDSNVEWINIAI